MRMKRACGVLALGLIAGSVSPALSSRKDQLHRGSEYKGCDLIRYQIKKKKDKVKVTFRANPSVGEKEPVVLTGAVVRLAFEEVQKKYGDSEIAVKIKHKEGERRIDSIESGAFSGARLLKSVAVADVSTIQTHSFENCSNLKVLSIGGDSIRTEAEICITCPKLKKLSIGGNNIEIGERTFAGVPVEEMSMSGKGISVAGNAFEGCQGLKEVSIGGDGIALGEGAFSGTSVKEVSIGGNAIAIGNRAFAGTFVEKVSMGGQAITVGAGAFGNCLRLEVVSIGCLQIKIDPTAFENCPALKKRPGATD